MTAAITPYTSLTRRKTDKRKSYTWLSYVLVFLFLIWILVPIVMVGQTSFKPSSDIFVLPPKLFFTPTLDHYTQIFSRQNFGQYLLNSVIVALSTMLLSITIGAISAYALARLPIWHKERWAFLILFCRMVPAIVLLVPLFTLTRLVGLANSYWAIIIAHTTFNLPFVIWMMRSFFEDIPVELEEASKIDGASRLGAFWRIALPLTAPGLVSAAILTMLFSWNEFLFALVLSGRDTRTIPIGVASFVGTVSIDWGGSSAAAVIAMVPVFILGLLVQRYLVRGLTMGAVKG